MAINEKKLKDIVEAALYAADQPLSIDRILALFIEEHDRPGREELRKILTELKQDYTEKGLELKEVSSGFRFQVRQELAPWISRLWEEKPPRYSRALLETLALIAYRQPITRAEIEEVRGVSVSTGMIKTLTERNWVKVVGHKDLPGKPALFATTREFLDYFDLKSLNELPTLSELREFESVNEELDLDGSEGSGNVEQDDEQAQDPLASLVSEETQESETGESITDSDESENDSDDEDTAETQTQVSQQIEDADTMVAMVEESDTVVSGADVVVEESDTVVSGADAVVEESETMVSGADSMAEESDTVASGADSMAEESDTVASGADTMIEESETMVSGADTMVEESETMVDETEENLSDRSETEVPSALSSDLAAIPVAETTN